MLSISKQVNNHLVRKRFLGHGDEAIYNTLFLMKKIINESLSDYYVRRWAEKIVESSKTDSEKISSVFNFLIVNTMYLKDPYGLEMLKYPNVSLQLIEIGEKPLLDCDDYSIISLSLLKSIGFPVALKAIAIHKDKKFRHVYGLVKFKDKWVPLDLTKPDRGIGWEFSNPTRVVELEV